MKYYAAANKYGSESSDGFANTWAVLVFDCKAKRDAYLADTSNRTARAIKKREIKDYIDAPKPFSGKRRAIETQYPSFFPFAADSIGSVELMWPGEGIDL